MSAELRAAAQAAIDYTALIAACYARTGHAQGTKGCVAFASGAQWYWEQMQSAPAAPIAQPDTEAVIHGLHSITNEDEGVLTLRFADEASAEAFMSSHRGDSEDSLSMREDAAPIAQPLTAEQRAALRIMLGHYGDDERVACLRPLAAGIGAAGAGRGFSGEPPPL